MHTICIRQTALALSLLLGGVAGPALGAEPRVWDVPDAIEAIDVPGRTVVGGMPVAMHAVRSKRDAASLELSFRAQFQKAGLWLGPMTQLTRHRQVTGLDVESLVTYSVFLQVNRDRTTTVILTETFAKERAPQGQVQFAPVMPGARQVTLAQLEGSELATYRVKANAGEVRAFYEETLVKAGWAPRGEQWERGEERLEVRVTQKGEEVVVALTVRSR